MGLIIRRKEKKMNVTCDFAFCVYNYGHECSLDKISICNGGVCDMAIDRMKVDLAAKAMEEQRKARGDKIVYR